MIGLLAILVAAAFAVWFANRAPVTAVPPVRSAPVGPPASTAAPAAVPVHAAACGAGSSARARSGDAGSGDGRSGARRR